MDHVVKKTNSIGSEALCIIEATLWKAFVNQRDYINMSNSKQNTISVAKNRRFYYVKASS